jgi:hypothetical protein
MPLPVQLAAFGDPEEATREWAHFRVLEEKD